MAAILDDVQARKHPNRGTREVDGTPPPWIIYLLQYFEEILPLVKKACDALYKMRYILSCSAARGLWCHPRWLPSWILPGISWKYQKTAEIHIFGARHVEYDIIKHFASFCQHFEKNTHFYSKLAWPPATYDAISRNHSNQFSPSLCHNVSKEYAYRFWKRQVLMNRHLLKEGGVASKTLFLTPFCLFSFQKRSENAPWDNS